MGSYSTNGNLELSKLVENLRHVGTVTKATFPAEVTVDGKSFTISDTGVVQQTGPQIATSNLKVTTVADKATEITTTSASKPKEGTPLELSFDVSISEGSIIGVDNGILSNGKVTYDTDGTETEVTFTFTLEGVDNSLNNTVTFDLSSFYKVSKTGEPNLTGIANMTYVTWTANNDETEYIINDTQTIEPDDWYDYDNGKWANIKTSNNGLEAYWVWIPRFEYIVPTSENATQIEVKFIPKSKKTADDGYIIHPAFKFGNTDLEGIWVAKFEATSSYPESSCGGGYNIYYQVQVKPGVQSWRNLPTKYIFDVCRNMQNVGGVLENSTNINSHMMKNIEWGAVAILSQSKYGVFNTKSKNNGQIWNNPYAYNAEMYVYTGYAGNSADASTKIDSKTAPTGVVEYNKGNGPKASTTGTVYGVYDMAGGSLEYVAGCLSGQENSIFGVTEGDNTYVDLYTNIEDSYSDFEGAILGDATQETYNWNDDYSFFVNSESPVFMRGGASYHGINAGIFYCGCTNRFAYQGWSFRPVFIEF